MPDVCELWLIDDIKIDGGWMAKRHRVSFKCDSFKLLLLPAWRRKTLDELEVTADEPARLGEARCRV
jgi:hypothetical protein